jgi:2-amino-4-hydroxy-6-hydroxymethyldihydropteridine diphosphokinase
MPVKTDHMYVIALGSNQRHAVLGRPAQILTHALAALETADIAVFRQSGIIHSRPVGPSHRTYANSAAIIISSLLPPELLTQLKRIERHFDRRHIGQQWRSRTLDLDIVLWSDGIWVSDTPRLSIPHMHWKERGFVLNPACEIAGDWRDPVTGRTIKQIFHHFMHPKPLDQKDMRY